MASRVGKYLLFETLGEGAFGKVKLGVHEETGEQVAVKIMDKSDIKAQEMTMNVRREIAIMKALKHRNIVNLRCVLTSNSKLYIVMDVVTGGELFTKILTEGKLEESVARRYFQQLVDGVEYCHRRGVCHRDLKPENLLIDSDSGELKITDFGLSAMRGADTTEALLHTQCGSPNYCAPEIIARHKQGYNGAKVDAWSCGIILFALLAGFLPFYDENTKVLYRMIQKDDVKFPRRFPPDAKDLVLRLLHKEPEKRINLVDVKKHPWFVVGYQGDDSSKGVTPVLSPPVAKPKRRRHSRKPSADVSATAAEAAAANAAAAAANGPGAEGASDVAAKSAPGDASAEGPPTQASGGGGQTSANVAPAGVPLPGVPPGGVPPAPGPPPVVPQTGVSPAGVPPPGIPPPGVPPSAHPPMPGGGQGEVAPGPYAPRAPQQGQHPYRGPHPGHTSAHAGVPHYGYQPGGHPAYARPVPPGPPPGPPPYQQPAAPPAQAPPAYTQAQPFENYQNQRYRHQHQRQSQYGPGLPPPPPPPMYQQPPPPGYQMPHAHRVSAPAGTGSAPPTYAAPSPPRHRYTSGGGSRGASAEVALSPSMEFGQTPSQARGMNGSTSSRGGLIDNVPSYASLSGGMGSTKSTDIGNRAPSPSGNAVVYPPAPPFPAPDTLPDGPHAARDSVPDSPPPVGQRPASSQAQPPSPPSPNRHTPSAVQAAPMLMPDAAWQRTGGGVSGTPGVVSGTRAPSTSSSAVESDTASPPSVKPPPGQHQLASEPHGEVSSSGTESSTPQLRPVSAPLTGQSPVESAGGTGKEDSQSESMSIVERRRNMFNQMAGGAPPPVASVTKMSSAKRASVPAAGVSVVSGPGPVASFEPVAPPESASEEEQQGPEVFKKSSSATSPSPEDNVDDPGPENGAENIIAAPGIVEMDSLEEIPTKKRLAAALARYRRIFQLRNSVGITASPSFGSNAANAASSSFLGASSGSGGLQAEDDINGGDPRAVFFARAKAVTGAWGVILTQELDDLDGSDEETVVTEDELRAFSKLLDFWDCRRNSARQAGNVVLDDHDVVPLTEEEIGDIQSLLHKLEPSPVDTVEEIADEANGDGETVVAAEPSNDEPNQAESDLKSESLAVPDDDDAEGLIERDFSDLKIEPDLDEVNSANSGPSSYGPVSAPLPLSRKPKSPSPQDQTQEQRLWLSDSTQRDPFRPPLPPHYPPGAASTSSPPSAAQPGPQGAVPGASPSTTSGGPVVYGTGSLPAGTGPPPVPTSRRRPHVSFDHVGALGGALAGALAESGDGRAVPGERGSLISGSKSVDADLDTMTGRRKTSHAAGGPGAETSQSGGTSREQPRVNSSVSGTSEESGATASRLRDVDPVAQKGMFGRGMFNRRTTVTSFDSGLEPQRCLVEVGRILQSMSCHVMMKKGESKMKCEVPLRNKEKMLVSITCTRLNGISTVSFKRGRRDRSKADSSYFQEFVDTVSARFRRSRAGNV